jgi:hypothetical protein
MSSIGFDLALDHAVTVPVPPAAIDDPLAVYRGA